MSRDVSQDTQVKPARVLGRLTILLPDIDEPCPKPTHSVPLGALIWKYIVWLEPELVSAGMFTEMAAPFLLYVAS